MNRITTLILLLFLSTSVSAQNTIKILHYSETSGFDHQTRNQSFSMFQQFQLPNSRNLTVIHDLDGSEFNNLSNLQTYDLIVFSNTSGNAILDSTQRSNFEQYIQNGGNLLGIHAATDTYRHSSANGSSTGVWDFYAETLGGSVQRAPNHVRGTPVYDISKFIPHQSTNHLPNPWSKAEEYYYWENGYLDSTIRIVLNVEETVGPNGQVNSYDSARAVSWYKQNVFGGKVFYTSMGHLSSNFTSDTLFQRHILEATNWCLGIISSIQEKKVPKFLLYPNPALDYLKVEFSKQDFSGNEFRIFDQQGKFIQSGIIEDQSTKIDLMNLPKGSYLLELRSRTGVSYSKPFMKN